MDHFRFTCQPGCTKCCEVEGFVYLSEDDLLKAAAFTGMTAADFEARYVYRMKHRMRLRKPPGAQCHFLREGGCAIHPAKPTQCRVFPFWPEAVRSRRAWKTLGQYCPGIGKGPLIQIQSVAPEVEAMKQAYPFMYK